MAVYCASPGARSRTQFLSTRTKPGSLRDIFFGIDKQLLMEILVLFYNVTTYWLALGDPNVYSDIVRDL